MEKLSERKKNFGGRKNVFGKEKSSEKKKKFSEREILSTQTQEETNTLLFTLW